GELCLGHLICFLQLYVSRRPQFYTWVLLIPTFVVITTVSIFGLFIPTNSLGDREEKVNLGLTTLLSSAVILEIVANSMPKASALPLLGNFILAEIFVVAVGVLFSVLTLTLHHRANTRRWRPKPWMLRILGMTVSLLIIEEGRGAVKKGSNKFISKKRDRMKRTKAGGSSNEAENYLRSEDLVLFCGKNDRFQCPMVD
ncbi:Neurotransmitter-gated ion-channel transmembrane region, partial [Cooperia oncophora]